MAFDNVIKEQLKLVETYLLEFCEVNGIPESELKNHLVVARYLSDNSVMAVNVDDQRDVKFGTRIKVLHEEKEPFDIEFTFEIGVFGEFLEHKDKFPKTLKRIEKKWRKYCNYFERITKCSKKLLLFLEKFKTRIT